MAKKLINWLVVVILLMGAIFAFNMLKGVTFVNVAGEQSNCVNMGAAGVCQQPKDSVNPVAIGGTNPDVTIEQHGSMEQSGDLLSALKVPVLIGGIVLVLIIAFWLKSLFKVS